MGLASQTIVHIVLFFCMLMLPPIPLRSVPILPWKNFFALYNVYCWALVDNVILALVQWRLFWMALKKENHS